MQSILTTILTTIFLIVLVALALIGEFVCLVIMWSIQDEREMEGKQKKNYG